MKLAVTGLSFAALLAVAACANNNTRPTDVGSMQTPTSYRPAVADPSRQTTRDVGSMAQPSATGGFAVREPTRPDTGSMALPSAAQGNSTPGRITP